jgi:diguanylate cyclase (GGDEF)-like protein
MITESSPVGDHGGVSVVGRFRLWSLWSLPRAAACYFLAVELVTLVLLTVALTYAHVTSVDLGRFALLAVLGLGYAEASDRVERFKRYLGKDGIWSDHTSVWAFAGVLVLPGPYAAVLVLLIYAQQLRLGHRHQSVHPHRVVFITSTMVLATLAGSGFLHAAAGGITTSGLRAALVTVGAFGIFPVVNLGVLISGRALAAKTTRMSSLLPDRDTVGFELMTLILGVFTASLVLHTPWLTPLVLGVLAGLHRSSLVKGLQVAATTDAKTGLLNNAAWQDRAEQGLSRASRANQPVAVVMIDLDHFKDINDTHGHLVGDRVLCRVADALSVELRGHDVLGRFGGEEFVAFLEGPTAKQTVDISERLRHCIASITTTDTPSVTGSIGVAYCTPPRHATLADLLQVADTALYEAKAGGRNRVDITHITHQHQAEHNTLPR